MTPRGVPACEAGYPFELLGFRKATEHFLFRAPQDAEGKSVCQDCELRTGCAGNIAAGKYNDGSPAMRPILNQRILDAMIRSEESLRPREIESVGWRTAEVSRGGYEVSVAFCGAEIDELLSAGIKTLVA